MRTVLLASLRVHTRRYVAALLAVGLAVAFVVATDALSSAARSGLNAGVSAPYANADVVVGEFYGMTPEEEERARETVRDAGGSTTTIGQAWEQLTSEDGRQLDAETTIGTVSTDQAFRWQKIVEGRAPTRIDEALVDERAATSRSISVGERLTIGSGSDLLEVTVVGVAAPVSYLSAPVYVPWEGLRTLPSAQPDVVLADAPSPSAVDALMTELASQVETPVRPTAEYVDERRTQVNDGIDVVSYLVLVFAAVATFVAILVVANTFTILFAQRSRDLALLRAVGARRTQLLRAVRLEALLIGVLASTLGLVAGGLGGLGVTALVRAFAGPQRIGAVSWSPAWWVAAFVGGVLVTVVASWWPTRSVVRISPLAALRPEDPTHVRSAVGRRRIVAGAIVLTLGAVPLGIGVATMHLWLAMLGCFTTFVAVLVLGPIVVPALIRLLGRGVGRGGAPERLAVDNAVRNPRRTAATTASLLVGVTLTATVLTVMATGRGAMKADLDQEYPVDLALTSTTAASDVVLEEVQDTQGVEHAVGVPGTVADAGDLGDVAVLAPDRSTDAVVRGDQDFLDVGPGEVLVPSDAENLDDIGVPERLTLTGPAGAVELRTKVVTSRIGGAYVVTAATLDRLTREPEMQAVWARAGSGADADDLGGNLGLVAREGGLELANQLDRRDWVDTQLDILVGAVVGLLGIAVLIALAGIGNTLGLSVLERGRENALVRALGLTRGQLRRSLGVEGLLLAAAAGLLGTALGIGYAWAGVRTVIDVAVPDATMVVPYGQLALVVVVATVAGLAACVVPARRAARIAPAEGLVAD